jgi:hypothetical protein
VVSLRAAASPASVALTIRACGWSVRAAAQAQRVGATLSDWEDRVMAEQHPMTGYAKVSS